MAHHKDILAERDEALILLAGLGLGELLLE
jgi:hypothetical protein